MGENGDCKIMVFRPSLEEFANFSEYIRYMESRGAHKAGIAKVIPPKEWHAAKHYNMRIIGEMAIETPVMQTVTGQQGLFQLFNVSKKQLKVKEFKQLAESSRFKGPDYEDLEKVERQFWKNVTFNPPIYGADVPGSIYDKDVKQWNITRLGTILDLLNTESQVKILGVNTPYLYFGMWKTAFPWHTEDMDLYSINYLHFGKPKSWYAVPPEHGKRLETLANGFFSGSFQDCSQFLRHKMTVISPHVLKKFSIPVDKITQYEGEFMITFPFGYHSGYNHGFNCAESTNFASERWIDYGRRAKHCQCKGDSVKIDMDLFIKKFQPEQWEKVIQERQKTRLIDMHNKRKLARAHYSSESKSLKLQIAVGKHKVRRYLSRNMLHKEEEEEEEDESDEEDNDKSDTTEDAEESSSNTSTDNSDSEDSDHEDTSTVTENSDEEEVFPEKENRRLEKCSSNEENVHCRHSVRRGGSRLQNRKRGILKKQSQLSRRSPIHKTEEEEGEFTAVKVGKCKEKKYGPVYDASSILEDMWNHLPPASASEYTFNKLLSFTETKCAICVYFSKKDADFLRSIDVANLETFKQHSPADDGCGKLLVTELCFAIDNSERNSIEMAFNLMFGNADKSKELELLTCAKCYVTVHNSCYGVQDRIANEEWFCDKCKIVNRMNYCMPYPNKSMHMGVPIVPDIKCKLCCLRGGALKETTDNEWCHIVCAISFPEVSFQNKGDRGPIDTSALNPARKKLNCLYCGHFNKEASERGACIQCKCGKCANSFHVTCSFHHGIPLMLGDWPVFIESLCPQHAKRKLSKNEKRNLSEVATDDLVIAKHKNGRFYRGKVLSTQMMLYYKVVFDDKSYCFDLPPDDIQGVDARSNVLPEGTIVNILWPPDLLTYRAEVTGHWYETLCQVKFEDGSILQVKRGDLYVEGEEIPKKVKSKLSYASETANKFYLADSLKCESKRPRGESWRSKMLTDDL